MTISNDVGDRSLMNVGAITALARSAVGTEVETIKRLREGDVPVVIVDKGREVKSAAGLVEEFERTQAHPYRRRGIYVAASVDSLLRWMSAECGPDAPVFGQGAEKIAENWKDPKLSFVGIGNYSEGDKPAWHDHGVRYDFPVTLNWKSWCESNGKWLEQAEFAEFVEDHLYEFDEPKRNEELTEAVTRMIEALGGGGVVASPTKIYDLARGIKLTVEEKVEVALDRSTGEQTLRFTEEHGGVAGRPLKVPKYFYIRIPIFFGEAPVLVGAMLRYRNAGGGKVVWQYQLHAPDLVVRDAFEQSCEIVRKGPRTLYLGTPDKP